MNTHKFIIASAIYFGLLGNAAQAHSVTSSSTVGTSTAEVHDIAGGWSLKETVLWKTVQNDADESVGKIEDVMIAPTGQVSFAILSVGGFLGMGTHDVAIPLSNFRLTSDGKMILPGATKEMLKALPKFELSY